jgi:hypothetical protein
MTRRTPFRRHMNDLGTYVSLYDSDDSPPRGGMDEAMNQNTRDAMGGSPGTLRGEGTANTTGEGAPALVQQQTAGGAHGCCGGASSGSSDGFELTWVNDLMTLQDVMDALAQLDANGIPLPENWMRNPGGRAPGQTRDYPSAQESPYVFNYQEQYTMNISVEYWQFPWFEDMSSTEQKAFVETHIPDFGIVPTTMRRNCTRTSGFLGTMAEDDLTRNASTRGGCGQGGPAVDMRSDRERRAAASDCRP